MSSAEDLQAGNLVVQAFIGCGDPSVGDQTAHLQWRLLNGQLLIQNPPRVAVLMIGTNDLGADSSCFGWNSSLALAAVNKAFERCSHLKSLRMKVKNG